jgi:D-tyrosyl-tRNA(Tyr) deacylase
MIAVIQRVDKASVTIDNKLYSEIEKGILVFLGVIKEDAEPDGDILAKKIANLRIMVDESRKMNKSVIETKGEILVVSQFTLAANLKGGRRPDFFTAMEPKKAENLYVKFIDLLKGHGLTVKTGLFSAYMKIESVNDGPVTFILNSKVL